jgi:hypothetical protein
MKQAHAGTVIFAFLVLLLQFSRLHRIGMYIEYHKLLTPQNLTELREDYKCVTGNSSMLLGIWSSRKTDADFDTVHKLSNLAPYVDMINTDFPANFFESPLPVDYEPSDTVKK